MQTAVLGTGIIGQKLTQALLRGGHDVAVYNRTAHKAEGLQKLGATVADSVEQAVRSAECILLALSDKKAVDDVLTGIKMTLNQKTFVQMGTILPQESISLARRIGEAGGEYCECPILGSRREIDERKLILLFGGSRRVLESTRSVLACFGAEPHFIGDVGQAAAMKLALNNLIAIHAAGFSFSLGIVERNGIDSEQFMTILRQSSLYAPMYDKKLANWRSRNFDNPNFPAKHLRKDTELILRHGHEIGLNTQVLDAIRDVLDQTLARGEGDMDYSALINVIHPVSE